MYDLKGSVGVLCSQDIAQITAFKKYKIVCKILIASKVIGIYDYLFADRGKYCDS